MRFEPIPIDTTVSQTNALPTELTRSALSEGISYYFKGCGMGTLSVLVSPCFRENVVVTCKIGSVLCSLDNLLQKNVDVFFFGNQILKSWRSFDKKKKLSLTYFSHFFSLQGKFTKIPTAHILLTNIHVICSPY